MKDKYVNWIAANITGTGYGQCSEATAAMARDFPELIRVRGHYYCPIWGERAHWWLVEQFSNEIIDPTVAQFPSKGIGQYVAWDEMKEEPTGMCPNCGGECYDGNFCCSDLCGRAYVAFCSGGAQ